MSTIADKLTLLNSTKTNIKDAIEAKGVTVGTIPFAEYPDKIALIEGNGGPPPPPEPEPWIRDPSWPACEANPGDNKAVGLYAVWPGVDSTDPGGNFFAVQNQGNYTIDYGDGTVTNYNNNDIAYYEYDFNNSALAGTDAPVTFTAATNTVNRTAHGYENGMIVRFYRIVTTTGISEAQQYYVINKTADTFQISLTEGGSAISLTGDGSASLLPYKVAVVTITPQSGANLTSLNFFIKHNRASLVNGYSTGWLDIAIAGANITSLTIGSSSTTLRHNNLQRVRLNQLGNITSFVSLFQNVISLKAVEIANTITTVTNMSSMFNSCSALTTVPLFDTSNVTNMSSMFQNCNSLTTVPLFDTSKVTDMNSMFLVCSALTTVPLFDTSNVTSMESFFSNCVSLRTVPLFDTSNVTNMQTMFMSCSSLTSVPLLDTSNVTNMLWMFLSCVSLTTVPLFDTSNVTSMNGMFQNCNSLTTVPLFDTSKVTNMGTMFLNCRALTTVPLFDTSNVTSMNIMFMSCSSLTSVPQFNTSNVTDMSSMFVNCTSLTAIPFFDTSNVTNMSSMFVNCTSLTAIPLFDTSNVTNMSSMFLSCVSLTTVPLFDTSNVTSMNRMFDRCSALTRVPAFNVTAVPSALGFGSMFTDCTSNTRIEAKDFRWSFSIRNNKLSGQAINEIFTNLPTAEEFQSISVGDNYGIIDSDFTIATDKGWTINF